MTFEIIKSGPRVAQWLDESALSRIEKPEESRRLFGDLLRRGQITVFAGLPGTGKSPVAVDLVIRAINGEEWAGFTINPCRVLLIADHRTCDQWGRKIGTRYEDSNPGLGPPSGRMQLLRLDVTCHTDIVLPLEVELRSGWKPDLIVVDGDTELSPLFWTAERPVRARDGINRLRQTCPDAAILVVHTTFESSRKPGLCGNECLDSLASCLWTVEPMSRTARRKTPRWLDHSSIDADGWQWAPFRVKVRVKDLGLAGTMIGELRGRKSFVEVVWRRIAFRR